MAFLIFSIGGLLTANDRLQVAGIAVAVAIYVAISYVVRKRPSGVA
jgi:hypothetical protein